MRADGCLGRRGEERGEAGDEEREALGEDVRSWVSEVEGRPLVGGRLELGDKKSP